MNHRDLLKVVLKDTWRVILHYRLLSAATVFAVIFGAALLFLTSGSRFSLAALTANQHTTNAKQATLTNKNASSSKLSGANSSSQSSTTIKSSNTTSGSSNPTYRGPIDGQPDGDKPPIPKATKQLIISPSTLTLYKYENVSNIKDGVTQATVAMSNSDGKSMYYPSADVTSGVTVTTSDFTTRPTWDMTVVPEYASPGIYKVPVKAVAADDSVSYVGTVTVTIIASFPTFSVSTNALSGSPTSPALTEYDCGDLSPIAYSSGFNPEYYPSISVTGPSGYNFTNVRYYDYGFYMDPVGTIPYGRFVNLTITVQNQFQQYSIPCTMHTSFY